MVLIDGRGASATDWFARIARLASDALVVGQPTKGMYTGVSYSDLDPPLSGTEPPMKLILSFERCFAMDGSIFEGLGTEPDVPVALAPDDLRAGVDGQLERAIDLVLAPAADRATLLARRAR